MFFRKKANKIDLKRRNTSFAPQHRVISYYTASKRQLDEFERQSGLLAQKNRQTSHHWRLAGKRWLWCLGVLAVLAIVGYSMIIGGQPKVNLSGVAYRNINDYQSVISGLSSNGFKDRIKILFNSNRAEQEILKQLPEVYSVDIQKSWLRNTLVINITTSQPMAVFSQPKQPDRLISTRGKIMLPVDQSVIAINELPLLQNDSGFEAVEGQQFVLPEEAEALNRLINQFKADNTLVTYNLTTIPKEIIASEAGRGYKVKFLLNDEIVRQYGALRAVEKKLAEINQSPQQYIDVRLADKAYYK